MTNLDPSQARRCRLADCALIVADIQLGTGDAMPAKVLNRVILNSCMLAKSAGLLEVPIFHTEQTKAELGSTHPEVINALPSSSQRFEKSSFSCCGAHGFQAALDRSGRRQVVIVGMESHVSVLQTALDLSAAGLDVYVVEDGICSRRLENYQNALDRMRQSDITVVSAESVVMEWLDSTAHDQYSAIKAVMR